MLGGGYYNHVGISNFDSITTTDPTAQLLGPPTRIGANSATMGGGFTIIREPCVWTACAYMAIMPALMGAASSTTAEPWSSQTQWSTKTTPQTGVVYHAGGNASYWHLTVYSNTASANGGSFYNGSGSPVLHSSIFQENRGTNGPAIFSGGAPDIDYNYYHAHIGVPVVGAPASADLNSNHQQPGSARFAGPTGREFSSIGHGRCFGHRRSALQHYL